MASMALCFCLGFALGLGSHRLGVLEHLRVGLARLDPGLQRQADLFGDGAVVELGDDVQLGPRAVGDANREGACRSIHQLASSARPGQKRWVRARHLNNITTLTPELLDATWEQYS